jgi:apolipoprotein N-acyltransferase
VVTGGEYWGRFEESRDGYVKPAEKSNVVYSFDRHGAMDERVYKKIHLVPFGEFIPFKQGCPPLYKLAMKLGPPDMDQYELTAGSDDQLTVYDLAHDPQGPTPDAPPWRYVTPICFEDIDADLCARMFRPDAGDRKRADVLVNVTNDGWFMANENGQHLQAAVFRSIENRVPTARAVNTGISGFIDPLGRTSGLLPARTDGPRAGQLQLDDRVTLFTRTGQLFARVCAGVTLAVIVASLGAWGVGKLRRT